MKRTLTLMLTALVLCTLLFGCGQKNEDGDPQDTNTEPALADGVYTADFNTDSSMFHVNEACEGRGTLTVADGKMTATIVWSSSHYDYMLVDGERCDVLSTESGSTFEIPVAALDTPLAVVGDTTAMSTPHEIDYTLTFDASSAEVNG